MYSNDNADNVLDIITQRRDQLISYLQNVTVLEFKISQTNFSDIYGVPNPNATNITIYDDEFAIARRRLSEQPDVIVPPFPEECIRINSTLVTATAEVIVPYDEHAVAYGIMRYLNVTQLTFLSSQSTLVTVCARDTTYTDRVLIPAPSPPPPSPPPPSPDDFTPPPAPPYVFTTAIAAPGSFMASGFIFLFACCCFGASGRRAGGFRNKFFGEHENSILAADGEEQKRLVDQSRSAATVPFYTTHKEKVNSRADLRQPLRARIDPVAHSPQRRGELSFKFTNAL